MADAELLATLVQTRGRLKTNLTKFITFLQKCEDEVNKRAELPVRLEKIVECWSKFDDIQSQIESTDNSELQTNERDTFEDAYFAAVTRARLWCTQPSITVPNLNLIPPEGQANVQQKPAVKLPTIDLPKFDGSCEQWMPFRELFQSLIDANAQLSNIQKLHYLKSALTDNAANVIKSLELSGNNYSIAWKLLKDRFENKRLTVHHHVQSLLDAPSVPKESCIALRKLSDDTLQHIQVLKKLQQPTDTWDTILIHILTPKLDSTTNREWEKERADKEELPTMKEFTDFLVKRCAFLESLSRSDQSDNSKPQTTGKLSNSQSKQKSQSNQNSNKGTNASYSYVASSEVSFPMCQGQHRIYHCDTFRNLSAQNRFDEAKKHKLCSNCLQNFHGRNCTTGSCRICRKHHNTLLHLDKPNNQDNNNNSNNKDTTSTELNTANNTTAPTTNKNQQMVPQASTSATLSHYTARSSSQVLLSTAVIFIQDSSENMHECRALLDSGSQSNFITQELSTRLQLHKQNVNTPIIGISQSTIHATHIANATIRSKHNAFQVNLPFLIIPKITEQLPVTKVEISDLQIPSNIILADPSFHTPSRIDLLLGTTIFWELLCIGQIRLSKQQPIFQKTQLGWIISGTVNSQKTQQGPTSSQCYLTFETHLQEQLERFWKIEQVEGPRHFSKEDQQCEEHFMTTHRRESDGRFIVKLPFKREPIELGNSKEIAHQRFLAVETKLKKNPNLKHQYEDFIHEYIKLNHATEIHNSNEDPKITYHLPHHAVVREDHTTTKLRVVFDGSCKTTSGQSLNDNLMVGPTIQHDLVSILLRFRENRYAVAADITKMYRQINVEPQQRHLQRILWRWKQDEPVKTFELNTVTYGLSCSPFLAIRCLQQTAKENISAYPEACNVILRDFYVDDLITGGNNIDQVTQLTQDITKVLSTAQFELRKWKSNEPTIVTDQNTEEPMVKFGEETKTLGLLWNTTTDNLQYKTDLFNNKLGASKRSILSTISQIFDPLGLVGPIIIQTKIILQRLWQLKIGWDESLPAELHSRWIRWYQQVQSINNITIPRHVVCNNYINIQLHGFCDSSEAAYGACVYLRSSTASGEHTVRLLCAKSRVAPLKNVSLPRLELCGAVLLAELCCKVIQSLTISINSIHYWSDSTITLAWIAGEPQQWNTFVANRVAEIQRNTESSQWHHVRSEKNPADVISRGIDPDQLEKCNLWWEGPRFLHEDIGEDWSSQPAIIEPDIPETKKSSRTMLTIKQ